MKRFLLGVLGVALIVLLVTRFLAPSAADRPLDPALPIHLPDGRVLPLSQVVEAARDERMGREPVESEEARRRKLAGPGEAASHAPSSAEPAEGSLYSLGMQAFAARRHDEAVALLRSVPVDDPDYSRAQRFVGWEILTKSQGRPLEGLPYAEEALFASPFEGNCWQDLGRVYARALGLPVR